MWGGRAPAAARGPPWVSGSVSVASVAARTAWSAPRPTVVAAMVVVTPVVMTVAATPVTDALDVDGLCVVRRGGDGAGLDDVTGRDSDHRSRLRRADTHRTTRSPSRSATRPSGSYAPSPSNAATARRRASSLRPGASRVADRRSTSSASRSACADARRLLGGDPSRVAARAVGEPGPPDARRVEDRPADDQQVGGADRVAGTPVVACQVIVHTRVHAPAPGACHDGERVPCSCPHSAKHGQPSGCRHADGTRCAG